MTSNVEYFARYEAIAAISRRMLTAARRALWSDLETGVKLDDAERMRKYALICQILADDAAIRDLANPRMANLSALFAGRPTRVLKELYGAR